MDQQLQSLDDASMQTAELEQREENDLIRSYHYASNLCQKMNKFQQSLELIDTAIIMTKQEIAQTFEQIDDGITEIPEPQSSDDSDSEELEFDSDGNSIHEMSVDIDCDDQEEEEEQKVIDDEYVIDVEFDENIKK